ncbi:hypothetical protein ACP4OV_003005 [Aristida adscensionis]
MCDFFWPSSADQGDLSDVVRASLQQPPLPAVAIAPSPSVCGGHVVSLGLPEEEDDEPLMLQGVNNHGDDDGAAHLQQLPVQADAGMEAMVISVGGGACGALLSPPSSSPSYPPAPPQALMPPAEGLLIHRIMPRPAGADREGDVAGAAPDMDEHAVETATMAAAHPGAPAIKRRKNLTKKVVCIPAPTAAPPPAGVGGRASTSGGEVVPSDLWAWRKYGQKPIKGSPYPRGYYRCSSSKGCSARKQVERSRTDPSMLVITYTSDHNHPWPTQRNSLAGSTRPPPSSSGKHSHHRHSISSAPLPPPQPHCRVADSIVTDDVTPRRQQLLLKQEVVDMDHAMAEQEYLVAAADHDMDMFTDIDGISNLGWEKQQQHAAADHDDHLEALPEEEDKQHQQQLLDPFSFSFFDWVGASFGGEEAANKGG